eukprot:Seg1731.6 transcript_id=Seg1731.6/GoldUCD/mRNA.D3Y31 product="hypothetical protein" protein_id=Seg1731.6/GoldUCD/D3Y31
MIFPSSSETHTGWYSTSTIDSSFAKMISSFVTKSTLQTSWNQNTLDSEIFSSATVPSIVLHTETSALSTILPPNQETSKIGKTASQASWDQTTVDSNILSSSPVPSAQLQSDTSSTVSKHLQVDHISYSLQMNEINASPTANLTTVQTSLKSTQILSLRDVTQASSIELGPLSLEETIMATSLETTQPLSLSDVTQASSIEHGPLSSEETILSTRLETIQTLSLSDVTQSSSIEHSLLSSEETTVPNSLIATQSLPLTEVTQFSTNEAGLRNWEETILTQTETLKQPASTFSKTISSPTGYSSVITASSFQATQSTLLAMASQSSFRNDSISYLQVAMTSDTKYEQTQAEHLKKTESLTKALLASESSNVVDTQSETNTLLVSTSIHLHPDEILSPGSNMPSSAYFLETMSLQRDTESSNLFGTQSLTNKSPVSTTIYLHADERTSSRNNMPSSAYFLETISSQRDTESSNLFGTQSLTNKSPVSTTIYLHADEITSSRNNMPSSAYFLETISSQRDTESSNLFGTQSLTNKSPTISSQRDTDSSNLFGTQSLTNKSPVSTTIYLHADEITSSRNNMPSSAYFLETISSQRDTDSTNLFGTQSLTNKSPVSTTIYLHADEITSSENNIPSSAYFLETISSQRDTESSNLFGTQSLTNKSPVSTTIYLHADEITSSENNMPSSAYFLQTMSSERDITQSTKDIQAISSQPWTSNTSIATSYGQRLQSSASSTYISESISSQRDTAYSTKDIQTTSSLTLNMNTIMATLSVSGSLYSTEEAPSQISTVTSEVSLWATGVSPEQSTSPDTPVSSLNQNAPIQTILTPTKSFGIGTSRDLTLSSPLINTSEQSLTSLSTSTSAQMTSTEGYKTSQVEVKTTPTKPISTGQAWLNTSSKVSELTTSSSRDVSLTKAPSIYAESTETRKTTLTESNFTPTQSLAETWLQTASDIFDFTASSSREVSLSKAPSLYVESIETQKTTVTESNLTPTQSLAETWLQTASDIFGFTAGSSRDVSLSKAPSLYMESIETQKTTVTESNLTPTQSLAETWLQTASNVPDFTASSSRDVSLAQAPSLYMESIETRKRILTESNLTPTQSLAEKWLPTASNVPDFTASSSGDVSLTKAPSVYVESIETRKTTVTESNFTPTQSLAETWLQTASNVSDFIASSSRDTSLTKAPSLHMESIETQKTTLTESNFTPTQSLAETWLQTASNVSDFTASSSRDTSLTKAPSLHMESIETQKTTLTESNFTPTQSLAKTWLQTASDVSDFTASSSRDVSLSKAPSVYVESIETQKTTLTETTLALMNSLAAGSTASSVPDSTTEPHNILHSKESLSTQTVFTVTHQTSLTETPMKSFEVISTSLLSASKVFEVTLASTSLTIMKEFISSQTESTATNEANLIDTGLTQTTPFAVESTPLPTASRTSEYGLKGSSITNTKETDSAQTYEAGITETTLTPTKSFEVESTRAQPASEISELVLATTNPISSMETISDQTESAGISKMALTEITLAPTELFEPGSTWEYNENKAFNSTSLSSSVASSKVLVSIQTKSTTANKMALTETTLTTTKYSGVTSTLLHNTSEVSEFTHTKTSIMDLKELVSTQHELTEIQQTSSTKSDIALTISHTTTSITTRLQSVSKVSKVPTSLSSSINLKATTSSQIESFETQQTSLTKEKSTTSTMSYVTASKSSSSQSDSRVPEVPTSLSSSIKLKETKSSQIQSIETQETSLIKESISPTISFVTASKSTSLQSDSRVSEAPTSLSRRINLKETKSSQTDSTETQQTSLTKESIRPTTSFVTASKSTLLQSESRVPEVHTSIPSSMNLKETASTQRGSTETQQTSRTTQYITLEEQSESTRMPRSIATSKASQKSSSMRTLKASISTLVESRLSTSALESTLELTKTSSRIHTAKTSSLSTTNTRENIIASTTRQEELRTSVNEIKQSTLVPQQSTVSALPSYTSAEVKSIMSSKVSQSAETRRLNSVYSSKPTDKTFLSTLIDSRFRTSISKSQQDPKTITSHIQTEKPSSASSTNAGKMITSSLLGLGSSEVETKQSTLAQQQRTVSIMPSYTSVEVQSVFATRSKSAKSSTPTHISSSEQTEKKYLTTLIEKRFSTSISKSQEDPRTIASQIRTEKLSSVSLTNTVKTFATSSLELGSSETETKQLTLAQQQSTVSVLPSYTSLAIKSVSQTTTKSAKPSRQSHTSIRKQANTVNLPTSIESRVFTTASKSQLQLTTAFSYIPAVESSRILTKKTGKPIITSTTSQLDWGSSEIETKQSTLGKMQRSTIIVLPSSIIEEFSPTLLAVTRSASNATTLFEKDMQSLSKLNTSNKSTDRLTVVPQGSPSSPFLLIDKSSYIGADAKGNSEMWSRQITTSFKTEVTSSFVAVGTLKPAVKEPLQININVETELTLGSIVELDGRVYSQNEALKLLGQPSSNMRKKMETVLTTLAREASLTKQGLRGKFLGCKDFAFRNGSIIAIFRMIFDVTAEISNSTTIINSLNDTLAAVNHRIRRNGVAFFVDPMSIKIKDFDECKHKAGTFCHNKATCLNFPSNFSFGCSCGHGYVGNGTLCSAKVIDNGTYDAPTIGIGIGIFLGIMSLGILIFAIYMIKKKAKERSKVSDVSIRLRKVPTKRAWSEA